MTHVTPYQSRAYTRAEQVADTTVHLIGVIGALLAVPVLITLAAVWRGDAALVTAMVVYGLSLIAMLACSASYNVASIRLPGGRALDILRRLDHAAIYVKIAGTYTPFAVIAGGSVGFWLLIGIWSSAAIGLLGKLFAPARLERLSLILYLAMGWAFVLAAGPVSQSITEATMMLIVIGGCLYTVGVLFHVWAHLPYQNAIWHLFVLVASFVFYAAMVVEIYAGT